MTTHFSKSYSYDHIFKTFIPEQEFTNKREKYFLDNHYIHQSDNPDDVIIKDAIAPFLQPVPLEVQEKLRKEGKDSPSAIVIPPALSGLNFKRDDRPIKENFITNTTSLPLNWKNYDNTSNATIKQRLSTRPLSQQYCGSCYAFSTATAISDVFIFAPETSLNFNPNISPMAILSFVNISDNSKCEGGNPMSTLEYISQYGILTSHCLNYSENINKNVFTYPTVGKNINNNVFDIFSGSNPVIYPSNTNVEFNRKGDMVYNTTATRADNSTLFSQMNLGELSVSDIQLSGNAGEYGPGSTASYSPFIDKHSNFYIPQSTDNKGICSISSENTTNSDSHFVYKVENVQHIVIDDYPNNPSQAIDIIKQHLYTYGTAVSGFVMYNNFNNAKCSSKFTGCYNVFDTTNGIYFDSEPYGANDPFSSSGAHAICVVGWGVYEADGTTDEDNIVHTPIILSNGVTLTSVPYWICRNSWGEAWNQTGYFKIAMNQKNITVPRSTNKYEINSKTSLEKYNTFINPSNKQAYNNIGGIIIFTPKTTFSMYPGPYQIGQKTTYYSSEPSPIENSVQSFTLQDYVPPPPPQAGRNSYTTVDESPANAALSQYLTPKNLMIGGAIILFLIVISLLSPNKSSKSNKND